MASAQNFKKFYSSMTEIPEDIRRSYKEGAPAYIVKPNSMSGYPELAKSVSNFWGSLVARPT